jgi:cytidine deaminase
MAANLHRLAAMAMTRAHAPYSKYNVGAAILTTDGRTFAGCNVENASFPEGWCAETSAIAHMVMDGGGRIAEVAVICDAVDGITPCGGCRQRLSEFGSPSTKIHLCDQNGVIESVTLGELLPKSFAMESTK